MLYFFGSLAFDTTPFNADSVDREADASIVAKPVFGAAPPKEFTGEGEDTITISGSILPTKKGGLGHLELAHEMRRAGARAPLMRGDGVRLGWYAIQKITEKHKDLMRGGIPFVIDYSIRFEKVEPDTGAGQSVISGLLSLFGA